MEMRYPSWAAQPLVISRIGSSVFACMAQTGIDMSRTFFPTRIAQSRAEKRAVKGSFQERGGLVAASAGTNGRGGRLRRRLRLLPNDSRGFLLMLFVVALSGNSVLGTVEAAKFSLSITALLLGLAALLKKRPLGSRRGFSILLLFGTIIAIQTVQLSSFSVVTVLGLLCRFVIAYSAVVLIRDFAGTYVRVMLAVATLSLAFYFLYQTAQVLGIDVAALTKPFTLFSAPNGENWSILVYTFFTAPPDSTRNAGMFWEPGVFAGYLNLALVFLCLIRARFSKRAYFVRFAVLSACLLTTKSTVGYIAIAVVLCLEVMARTRSGGRSRLIGYLGAGFVLALFCALTVNQQFIAPKIEHSIMVATSRPEGWRADRIGSILFDLDYIAARPLTGWGMLNETRLALNPELTDEEINGRGNGMSNFAATFGVLALLVWLVSTYRTLLLLSRHRKMLAVLGLLVLVISLNGECFLNYPLFLMFFFAFRPGRRFSRFLVWRQPRLLSHAPNNG